MENWKYYSRSRINIMANTKVKRDEYGVKYKYPDRDCKKCLKYPCFEGMNKCVSNFAAYGCTMWSKR